MSSREKIISAIEKAKKQSEENAQDAIIVPFKEADMILTMLKEHEPKLIAITTNEYGTKFYHCPNCNKTFYEPWELYKDYCYNCGQELNWDA